MSIAIDQGVGLEGIQRAALLQLYEGLNAEIDALNTEWAAKDTAFGSAMGQTPLVTVCENIPTGSFHEGHRPSLIEAAIDRYPNVSVMAYEAQPSGEQLDTVDIFNDSLFIEIMVKSQTFESATDEVAAETVVNRRIQRTTDAVKRVISRDPTLGGTQITLQDPPTINITDAFVRREKQSRGARWLWQGSRVEYIVNRYANIY